MAAANKNKTETTDNKPRIKRSVDFERLISQANLPQVLVRSIRSTLRAKKLFVTPEKLVIKIPDNDARVKCQEILLKWFDASVPQKAAIKDTLLESKSRDFKSEPTEVLRFFKENRRLPDEEERKRILLPPDKPLSA